MSEIVHVDVRASIPIQLWKGDDDAGQSLLHVELTDEDEIHLEMEGLDGFVSAAKLERALEIVRTLGQLRDPATLGIPENPIQTPEDVARVLGKNCKCPKCPRTFGTLRGVEQHLARSHKVNP